VLVADHEHAVPELLEALHERTRLEALAGDHEVGAEAVLARLVVG
jgi:hypothetical protein